uniref:Centrosomal protein 20 n=1 Tax=Leptobrachium leishanense TaxID=445787 RepID=A0A8C5R6Q5_9ANUR
ARTVTMLKDTLDKQGVIGQLKASVRAAVFEALDDENEPRPTLSHENLLINELIREYLEFNKYKYTVSVLTAETGLSEVPLDRQFLVRELNIMEDGKSQSAPFPFYIGHYSFKDSLQPLCDCSMLLAFRGAAPSRGPSYRITLCSFGVLRCLPVTILVDRDRRPSCGMRTAVCPPSSVKMGLASGRGDKL